MALGVGDIIRTTCNFLLENGVQYQNVYHHIFDGIGGISDAAVVADIETWAEAAYAELDDFTEDGTVGQLCFVDQVEFVVDEWKVVANIGTFSMDFAATVVTGMSANQISPFVVFKTARPKSVGRKFLFPTPENNQNRGIIDAAYIAAIVAYADDVVNDINLDVANDLHPGIPRTGVNDWLQFQVAIVTDLVGTQRRRRPGYGS